MCVFIILTLLTLDAHWICQHEEQSSRHAKSTIPTSGAGLPDWSLLVVARNIWHGLLSWTIRGSRAPGHISLGSVYQVLCRRLGSFPYVFLFRMATYTLVAVSQHSEYCTPLLDSIGADIEISAQIVGPGQRQKKVLLFNYLPNRVQQEFSTSFIFSALYDSSLSALSGLVSPRPKESPLILASRPALHHGLG